MLLKDANNRFAQKLYAWSQRDFLRELEEDCPLLRQIGFHKMRIGGFAKWNETLHSPERKQLALALTKRAHINAVKLNGEMMTTAEKRLCDDCVDYSTIYMRTLPPLSTAGESSPTYVPISKEVLFKDLIAVIPQELGVVKSRIKIVSCRKRVNEDWSILTEFRFDVRRRDLSFEYQFIRKDGKRNDEIGTGPFPRTLLLFYGLYNPTIVFVPSKSDSKPMAQAMVNLAVHFVRQANPLFSGLGCND